MYMRRGCRRHRRRGYPAPIVDLDESRAAALEAYQSMRAQVAIAH